MIRFDEIYFCLSFMKYEDWRDSLCTDNWMINMAIELMRSI